DRSGIDKRRRSGPRVRERWKAIEIDAAVARRLDHRDAAQRRQTNGDLLGATKLGKHVGIVSRPEGQCDLEQQHITGAKTRDRDGDGRGEATWRPDPAIV